MPSPTPDPLEDDPDIPVLTDRVAPGNVPIRHSPADVPAPPAANPAPPPEGLDPQLVAEVVQAVQDGIAVELERRLREHLLGEVHIAVNAAIVEVRRDVANMVGDAVADALARRKRPN